MPDAIATALGQPGLGWLFLAALVAGSVRGFAGFGTGMIFVPAAAQVLHAALEAGVDFLLENPAPRGDPALDSFWPQRAHIPQIWDTAPLRRFRERAGARAKLMVVPQCAFGPTPSGKNRYPKHTPSRM